MRPVAVVAIVAALLAGCAASPPGGTGTLPSDPPGTPPSESSSTSPSPAPPGGRQGGNPACDAAPMPRISGSASGPDRSKETLSVTVTASGAFQAEVPVPVSADGTQLAHWAANVSAPSGWTVQAARNAEGDVLRIAGTGSGAVASCALQPARGGNGCCAEQYLDATWGDAGTRPDAIPVHVTAGVLGGLRLEYEAGSSYCGAEAAFEGSGLRPGRNEVAGSAQAVCT